MEVTAGSGTVIRTDEISGQHYQIIKLALGSDGVLDGLLALGEALKSASLPVVLASDQELIKTKEDTTSVTLTARSSNGNSSDIDVENYREGNFYIKCTAVTEGSELTVFVKSKDPISGEYVEIGQVTVIETGLQLLQIDKNLGKTIQIEWQCSNSFVFSIGMHFKS